MSLEMIHCPHELFGAFWGHLQGPGPIYLHFFISLSCRGKNGPILLNVSMVSPIINVLK